jgi:hypothetical protein
VAGALTGVAAAFAGAFAGAFFAGAFFAGAALAAGAFFAGAFFTAAGLTGALRVGAALRVAGLRAVAVERAGAAEPREAADLAGAPRFAGGVAAFFAGAFRPAVAMTTPLVVKIACNRNDSAVRGQQRRSIYEPMRRRRH